MFTRKLRLTLTALATAGVLGLTACGGSDAADSDPNAAATLNFTFWGNDDRANRYKEAIAAFNQAHPNITVNATFTDYEAFWQKRATEAAGGGLPDVMQFDQTRLREYGERNTLLDLGEYQSKGLDVSGISEELLTTGKLEDKLLAVPTGSNAWANFANPELLKKYDQPEPKDGGTWEELADYYTEVTEATDGEVYGGTDYTQRIQGLELQLRQEGGNLFTEDGKLAFDQARLKKYWESTAALRSAKAVVPQAKLEQVAPKSGFGSNAAATEFSWDNFVAGFMADSGAKEVSLVAPPTSNPAAKDLYQKPALQLAISAKTEYPAQAATFVNFLTNDEQVGKIFGASRGIPADQQQRDAAALSGADAQVKAYEESVANRLGAAPPVPIKGFGTLESTFLRLGEEIGFGTTSVDDAVKQFFDEANQIVEA